MLIEQFIQHSAPKIGPNATFDFLRDSRTAALENLLMAKGLFSKTELEHAQSVELQKAATNVDNMFNAPNSPFRK
jgi:hypothetical protein